MNVLLLALLAYLVGSLPFAIIVSRLMGLADPRAYGSKNPGATNVLRSGNRFAALLTLVLDALKGLLPMLLVRHFSAQLGVDPELDSALAAVALGAFVGHLYPVFFRFAGGKGVATAAGVLFGIHWLLGAMVVLSWILIVVFSRYSSLAALVAAVAAPTFYLLFDRLQWHASASMTAALILMCALLVYRHRANIVRLLSGTESRIGSKK